MAKEFKITGVDKATEDLNKLMGAIKMAKDEMLLLLDANSKVFKGFDVPKSLKDSVKLQNELNESQKKLTETELKYSKLVQEKIRLNEKLKNQATEEYKEALKKKLQIQETDKLLREQIKTELGLGKAREKQLNAYEQMSKKARELKNESKDLKVQLLNLSEAGDTSSQTFVKLKNRLGEVEPEAQKLDKQLKNIDGNLGDYQRNVGDYANKFKDALGSIFSGDIKGGFEQFAEISRQPIGFKTSSTEPQNLLGGNNATGVIGGFQNFTSNKGNNPLTDISKNASDIGDSFEKSTPTLKGFQSALKGLVAQAWAFIATPIGAAIAVISGIAIGTKALFDYNKEVSALNKQLKAFGIDESQVNDVRANVTAISEVYDKEFGEVAKTINSLAKSFGISYKEAGDVLNEGLAQGGKYNEEFLYDLQEYDIFFQKAGYSAKDFASIINASYMLGVFNDKLPDAIKEMEISLSEFTKSSRDALIYAFGEDFADKIGNGIKNGTIKTKEALELISEQALKTGLDAEQLAKLSADVFRGAGEDAGGLIEIINVLNKATELRNKGLDESQKLQKELTDSTTEYEKALYDVAGVKGIDDIWQKVKIGFTDYITYFLKQFARIKESFNIISTSFSDIFKQSNIKDVLKSTLNFILKSVTEYVNTMVAIISNAIGGGFFGIAKKFDKLTKNIQKKLTLKVGFTTETENEKVKRFESEQTKKYNQAREKAEKSGSKTFVAQDKGVLATFDTKKGTKIIKNKKTEVDANAEYKSQQKAEKQILNDSKSNAKSQIDIENDKAKSKDDAINKQIAKEKSLIEIERLALEKSLENFSKSKKTMQEELDFLEYSSKKKIELIERERLNELRKKGLTEEDKKIINEKSQNEKDKVSTEKNQKTKDIKLSKIDGDIATSELNSKIQIENAKKLSAELIKIEKDRLDELLKLNIQSLELKNNLNFEEVENRRKSGANLTIEEARFLSDIIDLNRKNKDDKLKLDTQYSEQQKVISKIQYETEIIKAGNNSKDKLENITKFQEEEHKLFEEQLIRGLITQQQYNERIAEINKQVDEDKLKLKDEEIKQSQGHFNNLVSQLDGFSQYEKDITIATSEFGKELLANDFEERLELIQADNEQRIVENDKLLESKQISQEEHDEKEKGIKAETEANKQLLEEDSLNYKANLMKKGLDVAIAVAGKESDIGKALATFKIGLDTAQGVMNALKNNPDPIGKWIDVALITAAGVAQIIKVNSTPKPKFAMGTIDAPEGYATVDEQGAELHFNKNWKLKSFGKNSQNDRFLNKGDKIIPADISKEILRKSLILNSNFQNKSTEIDYEKLAKILKKDELKTHYVVIKDELMEIQQDGSTRKFILNSGINPNKIKTLAKWES